MNTPTSVVIGDRKQKLQSIKVEADVFAINPGILGFTGVITIFYRVVGGDRVELRFGSGEGCRPPILLPSMTN
jgi:hypothetical protein